MSGVLPDEFPFTLRLEPEPPPMPMEAQPEESAADLAPQEPIPQPPADAPIPSYLPWQLPPPVQGMPASARPAAPTTRILIDEPVVQVEMSGRVVYEGPERRRSPRQGLRTKALYKPENLASTFGPVQMNNISMLGARFWSPTPISRGDKGALKLEVGPLKWHAKLKVVSCIPASDGSKGHIIGGEFIGNELPRGRTAAAA